MPCSPDVPCTPWATIDDMAGKCLELAQAGDNQELFARMIAVATATAFRLTQSRYTGECETTILPLKRSEGCGPHGSIWTDEYYPSILNVTPHQLLSNCCTSKANQIKLPYYPACSITEVKLRGVTLTSDDYYIKDQKYLILKDDVWPTCQDVSDTVNITSVEYKHGIAPPIDLVEHTLDYACELAKRKLNQPCALPQRITVKEEAVILDPQTYVRNGQTGSAPLDACIKSINPSGATRPARAINPRKYRQSYSRVI